MGVAPWGAPSTKMLHQPPEAETKSSPEPFGLCTVLTCVGAEVGEEVVDGAIDTSSTAIDALGATLADGVTVATAASFVGAAFEEAVTTELVGATAGEECNSR